MIKFITIQKASELIGIDTSYIRKMINNKDLNSYKMNGYKRVYIDIDEFNSKFKPIHDTSSIDLDRYMI